MNGAIRRFRRRALSPAERIHVIQADSHSLRGQLEKIEESQRYVFRLILLGVAAVLAVKDIAVVMRLLPVAAILVMTVMALGVAEMAAVYRYNRWLARNESKINRIANEKLLVYEQAIWNWRKHRLDWSIRVYVASALVISAAYYLLVYWLMAVSDLSQDKHESLRKMIWGAAVLCNLIALVLFAWLLHEVRSDKAASRRKPALRVHAAP